MSPVQRGLWDAVSPIGGDGCRDSSASLESMERGVGAADYLIEREAGEAPRGSRSVRRRPLSIIPARQAGRGDRTHVPSGFRMHDTDRTCVSRTNGCFRQLSRAELKAFDAVAHVSAYPARSILFLERQMPRGIHVLCEGQVKLVLNSQNGKALILRIAGPGDVLDLAAVLSSNPYAVTAETLRPCQIAFVHKADFLRFLAAHPGAYQSVANHLCSHYQEASRSMSVLGLGLSVCEKLTTFLLHWASSETEEGARTHVALPLNHEEIAQCVGTSRESVTRGFRELERQHLVERRGSTLLIPDLERLQQFGSGAAMGDAARGCPPRPDFECKSSTLTPTGHFRRQA